MRARGHSMHLNHSWRSCVCSTGCVKTRRGVFYIKSRAFLHFHEDPAGFFCDIRLDPSAGFERFPVNIEAERLDVLSRVTDTLFRE